MRQRCAEHLDDALEVVSHDGDADFGLSACQASQQQTRIPEDAVFDCSEGMLNCGSPQPHRCWGGTRIHAVQRVVIDGTRDHSPCRLGTEGSTRAGSIDELNSDEWCDNSAPSVEN